MIASLLLFFLRMQASIEDGADSLSVLIGFLFFIFYNLVMLAIVCIRYSSFSFFIGYCLT